MNSDLIAPCGMNCSLCIGHLREKNKCPGCREMDGNESGCGRKCIIRNCDKIKEIKFCSEKCGKFPCKRLNNLDKRYKTKYGMSMIENLENIRKNGIRKFIETEKEKWIKDNKIFCVHNKKYFDIKS